VACAAGVADVAVRVALTHAQASGVSRWRQVSTRSGSAPMDQRANMPSSIQRATSGGRPGGPGEAGEAGEAGDPWVRSRAHGQPAASSRVAAAREDGSGPGGSEPAAG
jgi:hypothetical protein